MARSTSTRNSADRRSPLVASELGPYPALWRRAVAACIDAAIVAGLLWCGVLALLTAFTPGGPHPSAFGLGPVSRPGPIIIVFLLLACLWLSSLGLFYFPFEEAREAGQTIGKRVLGLRVVRLRDGRPLGTGGAFARYLARLTDLTGIGLLWAVLDPHRRTLHDCIAGSVVVDARRFRPVRRAPVTNARRLLRGLVGAIAVFDVIGIVIVTLVVVDAVRVPV